MQGQRWSVFTVTLLLRSVCLWCYYYSHIHTFSSFLKSSPSVRLHLCFCFCFCFLYFSPSSLQDELQEPEGVLGLAVLPVPAHHRHLRPGTLGKVHFQLHPLLRHRHGGVHLLRLRAHPRAPGTGVFLGDFWWTAREYDDADELKSRRRIWRNFERVA